MARTRKFFTHLRRVSPPEVGLRNISRVCKDWHGRILNITERMRRYEDQWQIHRELLTDINRALPLPSQESPLRDDIAKQRDTAATVVHDTERTRVMKGVRKSEVNVRREQYDKFLDHIRTTSQNELKRNIEAICDHEFKLIMGTPSSDTHSRRRATNNLDLYAYTVAYRLGLDFSFLNSLSNSYERRAADSARKTNEERAADSASKTRKTKK